MDDLMRNLVKELDTYCNNNTDVIRKIEMSDSVLSDSGFKAKDSVFELVDNMIDYCDKKVFISIEKQNRTIFIANDAEKKINIDSIGNFENKQERTEGQIGTFGYGHMAPFNVCNKQVIIDLIAQKIYFLIHENNKDEVAVYSHEIKESTEKIAKKLFDGARTFTIILNVFLDKYEKAIFNDDNRFSYEIGKRYAKFIQNNKEISIMHDKVIPIDPLFIKLPDDSDLCKKFKAITDDTLRFQITMKDVIDYISKKQIADSEEMKKRLISNYNSIINPNNSNKTDDEIDEDFMEKSINGQISLMKIGDAKNLYDEFYNEYPVYEFCGFGASHRSNGIHMYYNNVNIGVVDTNNDYDYDFVRQNANWFRCSLEFSTAFYKVFGIQINKNRYNISDDLIKLIQGNIMKSINEYLKKNGKNELKVNKGFSSFMTNAEKVFRKTNNIEQKPHDKAKNDAITKLRAYFKGVDDYILEETKGKKDKYINDITTGNTKDDSIDSIIQDVNVFAEKFKKVRDNLENNLLLDLEYFKNREFNSQFSVDVKCLKISDDHSIYFPISEKPSESEVLALLMILLSKDQNNRFCFPTIEKIGIDKIIDISSNGIDLMVKLSDWFENDNECNIRNAVIDVNNGKQYFDPQKIIKHFKTSEIEFDNSRSFAEIKAVCRVVTEKNVGGKLKVENEPHSLSMCSHLICWSVGNYRIDKIKKIDASDGVYVRDETRKDEEEKGIYFFKKESSVEEPHKLVLVIISELDVFDN